MQWWDFNCYPKVCIDQGMVCIGLDQSSICVDKLRIDQGITLVYVWSVHLYVRYMGTLVPTLVYTYE